VVENHFRWDRIPLAGRTVALKVIPVVRQSVSLAGRHQQSLPLQTRVVQTAYLGLRERAVETEQLLFFCRYVALTKHGSCVGMRNHASFTRAFTSATSLRSLSSDR
jgi:hypothetical protein